jgi:hypothetical protein
MNNRKELARARRKEAEAIASRQWIEELPRRVGQKVRWSNGVIWERTGDDRWQPGDEAGWFLSDGQPFAPSPSEHVANSDWTLFAGEPRS